MWQTDLGSRDTNGAAVLGRYVLGYEGGFQNLSPSQFLAKGKGGLSPWPKTGCGCGESACPEECPRPEQILINMSVVKQ